MVEASVETSCMLDISDWISIISLMVNSVLAIWIVYTIQNKLKNKRVLKDHLINEVLNIRNQYRTKIEKIHSSKSKPKELLPWFKLMNVKVSNLMEITSSKYGIDQKILSPFQQELRSIITEDEGFINSFSKNQEIKLTEETKGTLIKFLQDNSHLFNDAIVFINDA
jgi:hypothetical protein